MHNYRRAIRLLMTALFGYGGGGGGGDVAL